MSNNWIWIVILAAAAGHALRWVPASAAARSVKIPATFAVLYVLYAVAVAAGGLTGMLVALVVVEVLLQLSRRRRTDTPASRQGGAVVRRRR
jgi:hypothetical protein